MVLAEEAFCACMCVASHAAACVRGGTAEGLTVRSMASSLSQSQGIQRRPSRVGLHEQVDEHQVVAADLLPLAY
jgi:hypothetical protein